MKASAAETRLRAVRAPATLEEQARAVGESCLCFYVQRAGRALARGYDEALRPCDLTSWQFSILMSLTPAEAPSLGGLAEALVMDRTTLTANLKPLERRGLVAVKPDPQDRRVRRLTLTKRGRTLLTKALPYWKAAQAAAARKLGPAEADHLRAALTVLSREPAPLRGL